MPVYRLITNEMLKSWLSSLITNFNNFYNSLDEGLLKLYTLSLYEYLQCYCKFKLENEVDLENIKVSVKDIKSICSSDNFYYVINKLQALRNSIGHSDEVNIIDIVRLLLNDDFYFLLGELGISTSLMKEIRISCRAFLNKDNLSKECFKICSKLVEDMRGTDKNINSLVAELDSFPNMISSSVILKVLGTHYIV